MSLCRFSALSLPVCLQRPVPQISALSLFLFSPLSRDFYVGSPLTFTPSVFRDLLLKSLLLLFSSLPLSFKRSLCRFSAHFLPVCLQRPVTQISALALLLFPSLSFERSLCRFFTLCPPVCLQGPVTPISVLALHFSSPLSLSRDPYVGSPLSVPRSVFRPVTQISVLALLLSSPLSLLRDPYVGSLLSVLPSVFRDLFLRSLFLLFSSLPLSFKRSLCRFSAHFLALLLSSLFSLSRDPYVGSLLSVPLSVFRDLLL